MKTLNMLPILGAFFAYILAAAAPVCAETYYIDNQNGSDSNAGTNKDAAWKLCPGMKGFKAAYTHREGDVFIFKGGVTWSGEDLLTTAYSGGAENPDRYTVDKSWYSGRAWSPPVFDGNGGGARIIHSLGRDNLVFDGLKFVNAGLPSDGSGYGIRIGSGSNTEIRNCIFDTNSVNAMAFGGGKENSKKLYFHDNIIRNSGRIHVLTGDYALDDVQFYNNVFEGPGTYDPHKYHCDGIMIGADGTSEHKVTNLKIYNNKFYGDWTRGATAHIYLNGSLGHFSTRHTDIFNNLLVLEHVSRTGRAQLSPGFIYVFGGNDDIRIYNNTIDGNIDRAPVGACIALHNETSNVDIKNNILSGCDNGITIHKTMTGKVTADHNLFNTAFGNHLIWDARANNRYNSCQEIQANGFGRNFCRKGDPKFVASPAGSMGSGDFHLRPDSPAVDNGASLGALYAKDADGNSRPQGAGWDIGAYESKAAAVRSKLTPPANLRIVK